MTDNDQIKELKRDYNENLLNMWILMIIGFIFAILYLLSMTNLTFIGKIVCFCIYLLLILLVIKLIFKVGSIQEHIMKIEKDNRR